MHPKEEIDINSDKILNDEINYLPQTSPNKISKTMIAGILLIIAGIFAIINWSAFFTLNAETLESVVNISQFRELDPSITTEQILAYVTTCALIGVIISIFPILGGILSFRKKLWGISLACGIIGIFSLGILFTSSLFSLIAVILIFMSKQEFQ